MAKELQCAQAANLLGGDLKSHVMSILQIRHYVVGCFFSEQIFWEW